MGKAIKIDPFLLGRDFIRPMDIEVGPRGRLYIIEWGDQFWGSNPDAQLIRLDYYGSSGPPDSTPEEPITALPLHLDWPAEGSIFDFDSTYDYRVTVHDQALSHKVRVNVYAGVDTSPIPLMSYSGPKGEFSISRDHVQTPEVHYVDRFARIEACLHTACHPVKLQPRVKEAEHVTTAIRSARQTYATHPAHRHWRGTALTVMPLEDGSQLEYAPLNLQDIHELTLRFRTTGEGLLEFTTNHRDSSLARIQISPNTGESIIPHQATYLASVPVDFPDMESLDSNAYENWREVSIPDFP